MIGYWEAAPMAELLAMPEIRARKRAASMLRKILDEDERKYWEGEMSKTNRGLRRALDTRRQVRSTS